MVEKIGKIKFHLGFCSVAPAAPPCSYSCTSLEGKIGKIKFHLGFYSVAPATSPGFYSSSFYQKRDSLMLKSSCVYCSRVNLFSV